MYERKFIRNISIIAHIDHGKSTLADRILEMTHSVDLRKMRDQYLDSMEIERERGITIKAQPVKVMYDSVDGNRYEINLIDTPGHVDFTYEVSRSLAACEGVILLVDATQGVEAQTIANAYLAIDNGLEIVTAINKIDMPNANIEETQRELYDTLGIKPEETLLVSAKTGQGVRELIEEVIKRVPPPSGSEKDTLRALIFGANYDPYKGAVAHIKVVDGKVSKGDLVRMMSSGQSHEVSEVGIFAPDLYPTDSLSSGEVGYIAANMKEVSQARLGDTITLNSNPATKPLPGYKEMKAVVYAGIYPSDPQDYDNLRKAIERYKLNDAAFVFEPDNSAALGFGFRCGFLGLLHMEIVIERLEDEYDLDIIATAPNVIYEIVMADGSVKRFTDPSKIPPEGTYIEIREPYVNLTLITPVDSMGDLVNFIQNEKRGEFVSTENAGKNRVTLHFKMPMGEMIFDFFDKIKAISHGYASMDYEIDEYRKSDLVVIGILVNKERVEALDTVVHASKAYNVAKALVESIAESIPRHQFEIPIQATAHGRIIARATVNPFRKDVLAKCYGGDVTRKMKLLKKQKEGKKRMKMLGSVEIPKETFLSILSIGKENKN
ncbi:translation elongation factor 4 [Athalassotoga saccharophila]|uniref:translation elongation factor 4 n=1 Tax=Athalassotoga saccharophila TaxID=1441386 RepID=UPI00137AFC69|nr:translation elongation factor LepA [Athalassotoga saccharophila]